MGEDFVSTGEITQPIYTTMSFEITQPLYSDTIAAFCMNILLQHELSKKAT